MILNPPVDIINFVGHTRGKFKEGKPSLIILHYTAGGHYSGTIQSLKDTGLGYHLIVSRAGEIILCNLLNRICLHAGKSEFGELKDLNNHSIGISIANWGMLQKRDNKYYSWPKRWKNELDLKDENVVYIPSPNLLKRPCEAPFKDKTPRYWEKITKPQFDSLMLLLRYFVDNKFDPDNILGHDEVSLSGKIDPGGTFGCSVNYIRANLKQYLEEKK